MEINLEAYNFFIKPGITDMRKGSPSLAYIVQNEMKLEPFSIPVLRRNQANNQSDRLGP